jgi:hypothetical protein
MRNVANWAVNFEGSIYTETEGSIRTEYPEYRELTKILENRGLIRTLPNEDDINAQLTTEGAMLVEENQVPIIEDYDTFSQSPNEMKERIDLIIDQLTKLGFGQEILFDDLQELKDLYTTLTKKTWTQVLKGKLIDLGLAKILDLDTLDFIYHGLTDHQFFLPK